MQVQVGDYIAFRGTRGTLRASVTAVTEGADPQVTMKLLKRGVLSEVTRTHKLSELSDLRVGQDTHQVRELFSTVSEAAHLGAPPDIPMPAGVNLDRLKEVLGEVVVVTLPIGHAGVRSRNERTYGAKAMKRLVEQVNKKRPEGRWGHLKESEAGSKYEPAAVRWVAATLDAKGTAWGKMVALTPEAARHFAAAEAMGARVGTSIYGFDPIEEQGEIVDYDLVTIDLANPERVGVPQTAALPHITSEMDDVDAGEAPEAADDDLSESQSSEPKKGSNMPTEMRLEEMAREHERISGELRTLTEQNRSLREISEDMGEIRELFDIPDNADPVKHLRALLETYNEVKSENGQLLEAAMTALIADRVKVEDARPIVRELVAAKNAVTRKQLDRAMDEVLARDSVKALLARSVAEQAGPPVTPPAKSRDAAPKIEDYLDMPKED